jgi:hypothetical protein
LAVEGFQQEKAVIGTLSRKVCLLYNDKNLLSVISCSNFAKQQLKDFKKTPVRNGKAGFNYSRRGR